MTSFKPLTVVSFASIAFAPVVSLACEAVHSRRFACLMRPLARYTGAVIRKSSEREAALSV